jgi:hypothetical protein
LKYVRLIIIVREFLGLLRLLEMTATPYLSSNLIGLTRLDTGAFYFNLFAEYLGLSNPNRKMPGIS